MSADASLDSAVTTAVQNAFGRAVEANNAKPQGVNNASATAQQGSGQDELMIPYIKDRRVHDLFLWRKPYRSAFILGTCTILYFIIELSGWPMYTMISYALIVCIAASFLWSNAAAKVENSIKPENFLPPFVKNGITRKDVEKFMDTYMDKINSGLHALHVIVNGSSPLLSIKCIGALMSYGYATSFISPVSSAYFTLLALFTLPKLYERNREECDRVIAEIKTKLKDVYQQFDNIVLEKIPKASSAKSGEIPKKVE
eukprot:TRINITY_DN28127_c0_g1_i1.p1 TRINITY_DN28127_c0_g1~~TRINITY_DN28127_c0_g1_i1.p1  ORF type:complete len:270 (-),score=24.74 TRINITY_DN28127_c0_g1_i1:188-958(-)